MLDAMKADVRKLLTVRSTYILMIITTIIGAFVAFYVEAWWGGSGSAASRMTLTSSALSELMANSAGTVATFACIIAILQVCHEYRYNTIMYTLTASPSRARVYLSKMITVVAFSLAASSVAVLVIFGAYFLGLASKGVVLPSQDFNVLQELLRMGLYFIVYGMLGFLLGILLRNVIAAIALLFIVPSMIEPLLGMVLRDKAAYLPMAAFDQVIGVARVGAGITSGTAIVVSILYLVALSVLAVALFVRRDAN